MDILKIIGRKESLFAQDVTCVENDLRDIVKKSNFLIIGGAGSIGKAVTKEIFVRKPNLLHVVDISENNLAELVRDIRSSLGYIEGEFKTFALDCGSSEYEFFVSSNSTYDFVLNLSAMKHVRSEKDPFSLMRLINVNILNTLKTLELAKKNKTKKYFCVSTDKATNPVNMMGASKRIMEMFLMQEEDSIEISTARFANVAFSDGSLLHSFNQRFIQKHPLSGPNDVKRYFVSAKESGELCLMSCILGENKDIFFPKLSEKIKLTSFPEIAKRFLNEKGYEPYECSSEIEARTKIDKLISQKKWPCYFSASDTSGEKDTEEFFTSENILDNERFENIGIIKNKINPDDPELKNFLKRIEQFKISNKWSKKDLVKLFEETVKEFNHLETSKNLDEKM